MFSSEFWGVCEFGMALDILSFNVQCCVSVLFLIVAMLIGMN